MNKEKTIYYIILIASLIACIYKAISLDFFSWVFLLSLGLFFGLLSTKKEFTGKSWLPQKTNSYQPSYALKSANPFSEEELIAALPELNKEEKQSYIELSKLCCSPKVQKKLVPFFENLKDFSTDEDGYMTTLNYVMKFLEDNNYDFITRLDWKESVEELEFYVKSGLKNNHNGLEIDLPEYDGNKTVSDDNIFESFNQCLRKYHLQLGFIDTESDEYVFIIHKTSDKIKVEKLINTIGYKYFER